MGEENQILEKRAKELAKPLHTDIDDSLMIEVLTFQLADELYAIESNFIEEVYPIDQITHLPNTPDFVRGVINVRRKVVSVIDLKALFNLPVGEPQEVEKAIILDNSNMQFALLADSIKGVKQVQVNELQASLPTLSGIKQSLLKGLTKENKPLIVLDGEKILNSEHLQVT